MLNNLQEILPYVIYFGLFIIAGSVHEFAHAYSAYIMGDDTAKSQGRLTFNPFAHIDIFGTIILPLVLIFTGMPVIGWMKPVPINPYNFKKPSAGMALTAFAGPLSNFIQASLILLVIKTLLFFLSYQTIYSLVVYLYYFCSLNILLMVFNLLPVPPLDGSKILIHFLPTNAKIMVYRLERYGFLVLYLLFFMGIGRFVLSPILSVTQSTLSSLLLGNFFLAAVPLAGGLLAALLCFGGYYRDYKKSDPAFREKAGGYIYAKVNEIAAGNKRIAKQAAGLIRKRQNNQPYNFVDGLVLERLKKLQDPNPRLCAERRIACDSADCLCCCYYSSCVLRELDTAQTRI